MRSSEDTFVGANGGRLFERTWLPDRDPNAVVAIVHGYAEHSGRYAHVAQRLVQAGYAVHALDLRGHGRSEGPRAFVRDLAEHIDDLAIFHTRVRERTAGLPLVLLGHSMGGTIATLYVIERQPELHSLVLSGAALKLHGGVARLGEWLARLAARVFPRHLLRPLDSMVVSRDPAVIAAYQNDQLIFHDGMPVGTLAAILRAIRAIEARMARVTLPLLLMHGTEDALTLPEGSRRLYERARSDDKTLRLYEGLYHEVLNEPEKDQVIGDLVSWLDTRLR